MYVYIGMYARYMCTLCFLYVCIYIYVGICMVYIKAIHIPTYIYIYIHIYISMNNLNCFQITGSTNRRP